MIQKDPWILNKLSEIFGGKVSLVQSLNLLGGQAHRWRLYGASARGFAMTIYSFLSPRRQEQIKARGVFNRKEN